MPHDFLLLAIPNSAPFRRKAIELYQRGLSLRDVAAELKLSKTKIRKTLLPANVRLREWTAVAPGFLHQIKKWIKAVLGAAFTQFSLY